MNDGEKLNETWLPEKRFLQSLKVTVCQWYSSSHLYPTRFYKVKYTKQTHNLNRCKYRISTRGPSIKTRKRNYN